uniref:Uncharacterized protein MANES_16G084000 n=1 Tax=Rhizophora mucronata TaxID=61149 RepID=A0A2P2KSV6_RHIMU
MLVQLCSVWISGGLKFSYVNHVNLFLGLGNHVRLPACWFSCVLFGYRKFWKGKINFILRRS